MIKIENNSATSTTGKVVHKVGADAYGYKLSAFGCKESDFEEVDAMPLDLCAEAIEKINNLKAMLEDSDYKVNKFVEGWLTEAEFAPIRAERQALRDEINAVEQMTNEEYYEAYPEDNVIMDEPIEENDGLLPEDYDHDA